MILAASGATRPFDGQVAWFFQSLSFMSLQYMSSWAPELSYVALLLSFMALQYLSSWALILSDLVPSKFELRVSCGLSYMVPSKPELRASCGLSYVALLLSFMALQYLSS